MSLDKFLEVMEIDSRNWVEPHLAEVEKLLRIVKELVKTIKPYKGRDIRIDGCFEQIDEIADE